MNQENEPKDVIIATITGTGREPETLHYPVTTTSGTLVQDSTSHAGVDITTAPDYYEVMTETIERSRGAFGGGFKIKLTLPEALGGFGIEFERKPQTETKTTKKGVFRNPKK